MVKLRMNTADVAAEVRCLRRLIGMRCANVYDLTPKTYVIKLSKSSGVTESGESEKSLLLLESGVRFHTTEFARDKSATPSGFTLKLRKHIRTRRLEDVRQLGIDRVIDLQFGMGEGTHHIILELYAQGNILLTDGDYNVLTLLRTHRDEDKGLVMMAKHEYPVNACRLFERFSREKLEVAMREQKAPAEVEEMAEAKEVVPEEVKKGKGKAEKVTKEKKVKTPWGKKEDTGRTLKSVLAGSLGYGPALCEHIVLDSGLHSGMKVSVGVDGVLSISNEDISTLMAAITRFEDWLQSVVNGDRISEGFVYMQKKKIGKNKGEQQEEDEKVYDEFSPLHLKQFDDRQLMKMETYDAALDEFFSKIEGQRADQQRKAQEDSAFSKLDKIRADQTQRVEALKQEVDQTVRMAELIEYNLEDVDNAILAVRSILASGMDWKDLTRMIKEEKKAGNPVAGLIHSLQLDKNQITLLLSNNLDDMDDDEKTQPVNKVEVDIGISAHANARRWFEQKKKHAIKQDKTKAAHEKAFKAAEKKTLQQLAQAKSVAAISHMRKVHWFEKFNWFVSSENYLIISGRDAQQNELVVKRYMKKGDLYVHADLHGASSTVIKNHSPANPIPPLTINQAGMYTVCRSQAWDSKIVTSAWWVEAHQVSKTAPTGEYLTVGSFMVRGKKNFLPPNPLVMGFGLLFRLDDSSIAAHLNERRVRGEGEEGEVPSSKVVTEEDGLLPPGEGETRGEDDDDTLTLVTSSTTTSSEVFDTAELNAIKEEEGQDTPANEEEGDDLKHSDDEVEEKVDSEEIQDEKMNSGENSSDELSQLDALLDRALELRAGPKRSDSGSKYGLDSLPTQAQEVEDDLSVTKASQRERPYVSKAERRKAKKGGKADIDEERKPSEETNSKTSSVSSKDDKASDEKVGRGRKGKLKKIEGKYAEQDEDERELRMSLLASAGRKDVKAAASSQNKKKEANINSETGIETSTNEGDGVALDSKVCYKCKKSGHLARDCPETNVADGREAEATTPTEDVEDSTGTHEVRDGPTSETRESGKVEGGMSRRARAKAAEKEIAVLLAEENVQELGDDEREKLTELDSLTGCPTANDVLLYAVPVCAPYQALQGFKYRVKLTPGNAKKGKAAKFAVDVFSHMQEVSPREKELMKAMTDPEMVACMIGNVKVTAPGSTKLKQAQKKGKKASSKKE
ncbi:hypothetical protein KC19_5G137000 [Ceratodon purpureus]|uniref:CCHC-type domain-containing protein n=1 Tax=Ceratodon purpureus TaxID=3225 RepID=A0A8T0I3H2_CERPU|nr:hypothetical protein KC19_5G137000 [Ceratodon purpureus]